MKEAKYVVASEEGVSFASLRLGANFSVAVGDTVSLSLDNEKQERALIAAAWLKDPKEKEG